MNGDGDGDGSCCGEMVMAMVVESVVSGAMFDSICFPGCN